MSPAGEADGIGTDGRRAERSKIAISASLRKRGATAVNVQLLDLSITGFRIEAVHTLSRGDFVWIKIGALAPLEAHVAWFENFVAGCRFQTPLHPAVLDRIVAGAG